ncbi:hypothetical protein [Paeniglutamicibacter terrestris]|uniref:Uncharacterized protein n=1 Tax=Paeniglutamicibacter terrestris TaxID=2723403 RepID=A0ABX1G6V0_9MICC|nr:hypothetical protein [Paeniglutamicibacter terrestris]NKG21996.1 hypothetical protein [Paeniglutamicibacter terrestris]
MTAFFASLGIGAFGSLLLYLVFRLLKSDWPTNYSDMKNVVDSASQRNAWVYVLLRFVPMYVVSVLVISLSEATGGQRIVALVACAVLHVLLTNFRPQILRKAFRPSRNRPRYLVAFGSSLTSILLATFFAARTWVYWIPVLPNPGELVQAIWTSIFVGMVVVLLRTVGSFEDNPKKRIERAKHDLGDELQRVIEIEARDNEVSVEFIRAIILTECIQRPRWIRRLERAKGLISGPGTYGVAQVTSPEPISDELSIKVLCANYAGYYPAGHDSNGYNHTLLRVRFEDHNPDPVFVEQATEIYNSLFPDLLDTSQTWANDGRKLIEVLSLNRRGSKWIIKMSLGPAWQGLQMTTLTRNHLEKSSNIEISPDNRFRRFAEVSLPVDVLRVEFDTVDVAMSNDEPDSLVIDLDDPYLD